MNKQREMLERGLSGEAMAVKPRSTEKVTMPPEIFVIERGNSFFRGYVPPLYEKDGHEYYKGNCKNCGEMTRCVFLDDNKMMSCEINKPWQTNLRKHICKGVRKEE